MFWRAWIGAIAATVVAAASAWSGSPSVRFGLWGLALLITLLGAWSVQTAHAAALAQARAARAGLGGEPQAERGDEAKAESQPQPEPRRQPGPEALPVPVPAPAAVGVDRQRLPAEVEALRAEARRTQQAVQEIRRLTGRVNDMLASLGEATASQLKDLDRTGELARQVVQVFAEITEAAEEASEKAVRQRTEAEQVQRALAKVTEGMDAIRTAADSSAQSIRELDQHTSQIGEIVKLIQEVADQTNMLSLNAAIEAARAGDAGRGFAVVAQEIRMLADRSSRATRQIEELVGSIQAGTNTAIDVMEQSQAEVSRGVSTVEATGRAVEAVLRSFEQLFATVEGFGGRAERAAAQMETLFAAVKEATELAHRNNSTMRELAESSWFSNAITSAETAAAETAAQADAIGAQLSK